MARVALTVLADITDAASVDRLVAEVVDRLGKIDVFVANAGAAEGSDHVPVVDLDEDVFDLVQRVNVKGTFLTTRAVARHLIARHSVDPTNGGRILIMSSLAGKRPMPLYAAYSASKFALVGLTQSLAHELGPHGITVNALCPGFIPTERATATAGALREPGESIDHRIASMVQQREAVSALGRIGGGRRRGPRRRIPCVGRGRLPHRPRRLHLRWRVHGVGRASANPPRRNVQRGRLYCRR